MFLLKTFWSRRAGAPLEHHRQRLRHKHVWNAGQQYAFNFNSTDQAGDCPWCFSSDINLSNNVIKNISADFVIIATQNGSGGGCPPFLKRVLIQNNLFFAAGAAPFIGHAGPDWAVVDNNGGCTYAGPPQGTDSLQILHNTYLGDQVNGQVSDDWPLELHQPLSKGQHH